MRLAGCGYVLFSRGDAGRAQARRETEYNLRPGHRTQAISGTGKRARCMKKGELVTQYGHLSPGQVRMCAGNGTCAMAKKDAVRVDDVARALAAL